MKLNCSCTTIEKVVNLHFKSRGRAVVARRAHNPKVAGSSPALATLRSSFEGLFFIGISQPYRDDDTNPPDY
jgi:hypothetical protein